MSSRDHAGFTRRDGTIGITMDPTVQPITRAANLEEPTESYISIRTMAEIISVLAFCRVLAYPVIEALKIFCILSLRK